MEEDNKIFQGEDLDVCEKFIEENEVAQEVDDQTEQNQIDAKGFDDGDIEIEMSNNSFAYFDQHTDSLFTVMRHPLLPVVVTGGGDNVARIWGYDSTHTHSVDILEHSESVIGGGFSASGEYLVTGDMNGQVLVHKSIRGGAEWKKIALIQEVDEVLWIKFHTRKNGYFAFGAVDGSVWCYQIDETNDELVHLMSGYLHSRDCSMGEFVDVGKCEYDLTLVTCSLDGTIVGWNCFTGEAKFKSSALELKNIEAPWITLSFAPLELTKGRPIVACGSSNGVLVVLNCENGAALELKDDLDGSIESIAWSAQRRMMALGLVSGEIFLYDTNTWRARHKFSLPDSVTKLIFDNSSGDCLFASCIDGKVYQFDARSGKEIHICMGHNMGVLDFALDEENKIIITAGDEGVSLVFRYH